MRLRATPRHKFNARKTVIDGITFASQREANRYRELRMFEKAGAIVGLELQPRYDLHTVTSAGEVVKVGVYTADFRYITGREGEIVEDVKSKATKTTAYRLRKRIVEAQYGIRITEV